MRLAELALTTELSFDCILVPEGAEAAAVRRGLKLAQASIPVLAIAMGPQATTTRLVSALNQGQLAGARRVLVLGVAGSLSPQLGVGAVVIYERVVSQQAGTPVWNCSAAAALRQRLPEAERVTALSCDRLIHQAQEKQRLQTQAQVVDMEAGAIAQCLQSIDLEIATVRIISDDLYRDLPDLSRATRADGTLDGVGMAIALLQQPRAALALISGSLQALKVLEKTTYRIFAR